MSNLRRQLTPEQQAAYERTEFNTDLADWYPKLVAAGIRTPRTAIVRTMLDLSEEGEIWAEQPAALKTFIQQLDHAALEVGGYPVFMRTGFGSGKHRWRYTCSIEHPRDWQSHVAALAEWSDIVDPLGLPTDVWAIREWLTLPHAYTAFDGMPLAQEFRFFVRDGAIACFHPYWPAEAVKQGRPKPVPGVTAVPIDLYVEYLHRLLSGDRIELEDMTERAAAAFPGQAFSIDFAFADLPERAWYAIDMAEMGRSYHWPGCPNEPEDQQASRASEEAVKQSEVEIFGELPGDG